MHSPMSVDTEEDPQEQPLREHLLPTYLDIDQDAQPRPNSWRNPNTNLLAHKAGGSAEQQNPNMILPPPSRRKRKCTKRHKHPSRLRNGDSHGPELQREIHNEGRTFSGKNTVTEQGSKPCEDAAASQLLADRKLKSRPKRKCRFGPRARRLHQANLLAGIPPATPLQAPTVSSRLQPVVTHTSQHTASLIFPDRVTLQHAILPKRTPLISTKRTLFLRSNRTRSDMQPDDLGFWKRSSRFPSMLNSMISSVRSRPCTGGTLTHSLRTKRVVAVVLKKTPEGIRTIFVSAPLLSLRGPQGHPSPLVHTLTPPTASSVPKDGCDRTKGSAGPSARGGRRKLRSSPLTRRDPPPSPPPSRPSRPPALDLIVEASITSRQVGALLSTERIRSDPVQPSARHDHGDGKCDHHTILPDRPTFINFSPAKGSPFKRYLGSQSEVVRPLNPFPIHRRLGLTEEAFEAALTSEIDDVLVASAEHRRRARETVEGSQSPEGDSSADV